MTPTEWMTFAVGVVTVLTAVVTGVKWLVRHYFNELKPNGGGSMKDQVNRLEKQNETLTQKIDRMYEILLEHVSKH